MPTTHDSAMDLAAALHQDAGLQGRHEEEIGYPDPGRPDWYAPRQVDEQSGLFGQVNPGAST